MVALGVGALVILPESASPVTVLAEYVDRVSLGDLEGATSLTVFALMATSTYDSAVETLESRLDGQGTRFLVINHAEEVPYTALARHHLFLADQARMRIEQETGTVIPLDNSLVCGVRVNLTTVYDDRESTTTAMVPFLNVNSQWYLVISIFWG
jgi:hypothetical protein